METVVSRCATNSTRSELAVFWTIIAETIVVSVRSLVLDCFTTLSSKYAVLPRGKWRTPLTVSTTYSRPALSRVFVLEVRFPISKIVSNVMTVYNCTLGDRVGRAVYFKVGSAEGSTVGSSVGSSVGIYVGVSEGCEGALLMLEVGS
jgi:hypothetical protein